MVECRKGHLKRSCDLWPLMVIMQPIQDHSRGREQGNTGGPLLCSFPPAGAPCWTNPAGHQWTSEPVKVTCTGLPLKQRSSCKRVKSAGERVGNSSYLAQ